MSDFLENTICQFHQLQTIAVDLNLFIEIDKKQLCAKCLVIRESSNHQIVLNEKFKAIVKEIKFDQYQNQRRIYEESHPKYKEIYSKLQNYQDCLNAKIKKTLSLIDHYVKDQKKHFEQIIEPNDSINKQDLLIFIEKSNSARPTQKSIQNLIDKDQEFQKLLQDQFRNLHQEGSYLELTTLVDQIQESNQSKELSFDIYSQYLNTKKTSNLQHQCSKHGKEIIMFAINEKYESDRLLCIDCIPNTITKILQLLKKPIKCGQFIKDKYMKEIMNFQIVGKNYNNKYQLLFLSINIKRMLQNEIMQLIEIQNKDIKKQLTDLEQNKNQKQLMQLEQKEILTVLDLLAKNDIMSQVKKFQTRLKFDYQKYSKEIFFKLNEIEQHYQNSRQELFKLFDMNDQLFKDSQIQIDRFQQEIENLQLDSGIFTHLIPKFLNQFYQIQLVLMQRVNDKGHEYIKQLNDYLNLKGSKINQIKSKAKK